MGEGGEGGGSWVTEGWEVGEEKFVKWEKTDPPPKKMWINNLKKFSLPCQEEGGRDKWWKWSFKKQEFKKVDHR